MNESTIRYRNALPEDYSAIKDLMCEVGWNSCTVDEKKFARTIANSDRTVVALEGTRIVGFAKAICDDELIGYISSVAVSTDRRNKSIGSNMIKILIGDNPNIKWVITTSAMSTSFWQKHGFKVMHGAMVRPREADELSVTTVPLTTKKSFTKYVAGSLKKIIKLIYSIFV